MASRARASRRSLAVVSVVIAFVLVVATLRAPRTPRMTHEEERDNDDARRGHAAFEHARPDAKSTSASRVEEQYREILADPRAWFKFASERGEHALVTGGAGFIGAHCVKLSLIHI